MTAWALRGDILDWKRFYFVCIFSCVSLPLLRVELFKVTTQALPLWPVLVESCTKVLPVKAEPSKLSMMALPLSIAFQFFWLLRVDFFKVTTKALPLCPVLFESCTHEGSACEG